LIIARCAMSAGSQAVWAVLRKQGIELERRHSWCVSTDPQFTEKAADVVGLYMAPPENAIVMPLSKTRSTAKPGATLKIGWRGSAQ
jgi:hypothetical protein